MRKIALVTMLKNKELREGMARWIKEGKVFAYPTDTVYGLGCDAMNKEAVNIVRKMKKTSHPFSVIAPSKEWIKENLILSNPSCLEKLPGPYTLIFRKKRPFLSEASSTNKLGIRIPDHPLTPIIQSACRPFITTSFNISGQKTIISADEIPAEMERNVDVIIDGGLLDNPPSAIIDLSGKETETIR